jgi:very-short-patch-repair endonuclease
MDTKIGKPRSAPRPPSLTLPLKGGEDQTGGTQQDYNLRAQPSDKPTAEHTRLLGLGQMAGNVSLYNTGAGNPIPSPLEGEGQDRGSKLPPKASKGYDRLTGGKAKQLRRNSTEPERKLWQHLRLKIVEGHKFRRQQPVGPYICDFVCLENKLVIELDGGQHSWTTQHDVERDAWLRERGYKVLRFWNAEVLKNLDGVLEVIYGALMEGDSGKRRMQGDREPASASS